MDQAHHLRDEGAHGGAGERTPGVPGAHPQGHPLRLVDHVPAQDRVLAAVAFEERHKNPFQETAAEGGHAQEETPPAQAHAAYDARPGEQQEVDEGEQDTQAGLAGDLDGGLDIAEETVVEAERVAVFVDGQARAPIAEHEPAQAGDSATGQALQGLPESAAAVGAREAARGLPGVGPEIEAVVQPGQVDPQQESPKGVAPPLT